MPIVITDARPAGTGALRLETYADAVLDAENSSAAECMTHLTCAITVQAIERGKSFGLIINVARRPTLLFYETKFIGLVETSCVYTRGIRNARMWAAPPAVLLSWRSSLRNHHRRLHLLAFESIGNLCPQIFIGRHQKQAVRPGSHLAVPHRSSLQPRSKKP